jgi:hypothetical protein
VHDITWNHTGAHLMPCTIGDAGPNRMRRAASGERRDSRATRRGEGGRTRPGTTNRSIRTSNVQAPTTARGPRPPRSTVDFFGGSYFFVYGFSVEVERPWPPLLLTALPYTPFSWHPGLIERQLSEVGMET